MVEEIFMIEVKPETGKDFEKVFKKVSELMISVKGFHKSELRSCIEKENQYLISITWETVDDHLIGFKNSHVFQEMKSLLGPFYLHPPNVHHYRKVVL